MATSPEAVLHTRGVMIVHDAEIAVLLRRYQCSNLQIRDDDLTRSDGAEFRASKRELKNEKRNCGGYRRLCRPGQGHSP
jgi:hypothetical protein